MYKRDVENQIQKVLEMGKIAILYGARQTGKTTLATHLAKSYPNGEVLYLSCDEPDIDQALTGKTSTELKSFIGDNKLIIIDEAQRVADIGLTLKLLHDSFPGLKIIVTGSSSLELANKVSEPLTGRSVCLKLYPLSIRELMQKFSGVELKRILGEILRFGAYPEVVETAKADVVPLLENITQNYLYKDLLEFGEIKNSDLVRNLLQVLALQLGNEVSLSELSILLSVRKNTIKKYLELLEKAFIIYRLKPLARNKRNEVGKFKKVYFYDLGIRNMLIGNLNPMNLRNDVGALWENFCINERMKYLQFKRIPANTYFWRNYYGAEVDFIEEWAGEIRGYEFKWKKGRFTRPKAFLESYENSDVKLINMDGVEKLWSRYKEI